jgi:phospholipid/cholesterol/gamma-HCH transport system permease protein
VIDQLVALGRALDFAARTLRVLPGTPVRRPGALIRQFERVVWGSLAIVAASGFSVGLVTWLQLRRQFINYGLEDTVPGVLATFVLVEIGPLLAALLLAGRLGAGLAAELASMGLTEELDAREVLGAEPFRTLVGPRVLACVLGAPLLTLAFDGAALAGGLSAELGFGTLSARGFGQRALDFLWLRDVVPATLKTAVFGLLVGLIGCGTGFAAERSTEAVGRAATRGVVRASLGVFAANAVLVPLLQALADAIGRAG